MLENRYFSIKQFINGMQKKYQFSESGSVAAILALSPTCSLKTSIDVQFSTVSARLFPKDCTWYWLIILLAIGTLITIFIAPDNYPFICIRHFFGAIFFFFLPGYALTKIIFPSKSDMRSSSTKISVLERLLLSFISSISLAALIGFLLNYTSYGIHQIPVVVSLFAVTVTFATIGLFREKGVF